MVVKKSTLTRQYYIEKTFNLNIKLNGNICIYIHVKGSYHTVSPKTQTFDNLDILQIARVSNLRDNKQTMAISAHSWPWPLIRFRNHFSQTSELIERVFSQSQGRYLSMGQHKHNKRIHTTNINSLSGIRTHDSSVRAS
jgi:hypothetical protein